MCRIFYDEKLKHYFIPNKIFFKVEAETQAKGKLKLLYSCVFVELLHVIVCNNWKIESSHYYPIHSCQNFSINECIYMLSFLKRRKIYKVYV